MTFVRYKFGYEMKRPETRAIKSRYDLDPADPMGTQALILGELRRLLRSSGLLYRDVAKRIGVSEATIKRQLRGRSTTLATLERICNCLGLSLIDVADMASRESAVSDRQLTIEQEDGLAQDLMTAFLFMLLRVGWSAEELRKEFDLSEPELVRRLIALEKLGLIDLYPGNRIILRAPRSPQWRENGPMRRAFRRSIYQRFIEADPNQERSHWDFDTFSLSTASVQQLNSMLTGLVDEARKLAAIDRLQRQERRAWYAIFAVARPVQPQALWN